MNKQVTGEQVLLMERMKLLKACHAHAQKFHADAKWNDLITVLESMEGQIKQLRSLAYTVSLNPPQAPAAEKERHPSSNWDSAGSTPAGGTEAKGDV